jgi:hypothetical protein
VRKWGDRNKEPNSKYLSEKRGGEFIWIQKEKTNPPLKPDLPGDAAAVAPALHNPMENR